MTDRVVTLRRLAAEHDADGVVLMEPVDVRWAVGFTGSNALLAVTERAAHLVTDGRYTSQARAEVAGAEVSIAPGAPAAYAGAHDLLAGAARIAVQSDKLTVAQLDALRQAVPAVEFVPVRELLVEAVASKTPAEVEAVRQSQALTCDVFSAVLPYVQPGITERAVAAEIVYQHLRRGASSMAFEPIVAAGPRGALPHARPSGRTLAPGDLVVIDMGGVLDGYCSDLTRTVAVGAPPDDARRAYEVVRNAQSAAIDAARSGMTGRQLDAVARDVIDAAGLGEAFSHSLGHGVGLDVHEWPRLSQQVEHRLPENATVTIEPGVYLEGRFGVRIEDVVALREGGCDNLTPLPTDLLVL